MLSKTRIKGIHRNRLNKAALIAILNLCLKRKIKKNQLKNATSEAKAKTLYCMTTRNTLN